MPADAVLEIRGLTVDYGYGEDAVHAVSDCDLVLRRGKVLGLAGESGSGKTTLALAAVRLLRPPAVITAGAVRFRSPKGVVDMLDATQPQLRAVRWSEIAVVLQSSLNALNPVTSVGAQFDDLLRAHRPLLGRSGRADREFLEKCFHKLLINFAWWVNKVDAQGNNIFEGGFLGLDNITVVDRSHALLDVVTQREIIEELIGLRDRLGFAALFITHDLSLLVEIADEIAVMYAGRVMERAPAASLFHAPRLPYTHGLLHCFPPLHGRRAPMEGIPGSPPDLRDLPTGCAFHPRCRWALEQCRTQVPQLSLVDGSRREVACWLHDGGQTVPDELARRDPMLVAQ